MTTRLAPDLRAYRRYQVLWPVEVDQDGGVHYGLRIEPGRDEQRLPIDDRPDWRVWLVLLVLTAVWGLVLGGLAVLLTIRVLGG